MRTKFVAAGAGLLALGTSLFVTTTASATAPPPVLRITSGTTVPVGGTLEFQASCNGTPSDVTSPGLAAPVALGSKGGADYVGYGRAGNRPGHFTASFPCSAPSGTPANGTATAEFTVVCTLPQPTSTENPTGTQIPTSTQKPTDTQQPTSTHQPTPTSTSRTETTPSLTSKPTPEAVAPAASTSCSPAPSTSPRGPQVTIKPKGAPETGDGSTATS